MDKQLVNYLNIGHNDKAIETVHILWDKALQLLNPQIWQSCITYQDFMRLFDPYAQKSLAISNLLSGATRVCLMAASIGGELEKAVRQYLTKNKSFKGYMLDRIGNYLLEQQIQEIDEKITLKMKKEGYLTTRRYSPGYKDFSLEAQQVFVNLIHEAIPDIQIMANRLLKPEKTITALKGLIPIGKADGKER